LNLNWPLLHSLTEFLDDRPINDCEQRWYDLREFGSIKI
jgi:hypothetical protein